MYPSHPFCRAEVPTFVSPHLTLPQYLPKTGPSPPTTPPFSLVPFFSLLLLSLSLSLTNLARFVAHHHPAPSLFHSFHAAFCSSGPVSSSVGWLFYSLAHLRRFLRFPQGLSFCCLSSLLSPTTRILFPAFFFRSQRAGATLGRH